MLYPTGSDLPFGHLIMNKTISTRRSMDPSPSLIAPEVSLSHGAHVFLEAK